MGYQLKCLFLKAEGKLDEAAGNFEEELQELKGVFGKVEMEKRKRIFEDGYSVYPWSRVRANLYFPFFESKELY